MLPPLTERPKLTAVLTQLGDSVEELLLSGLTTASAGSRQTLAAAMQEAARFRLLRLGSTLRTATEELARFTSQDATFSRRRLTFFLSRAWLLSRGLNQALQTGNEQEYERLNWSPSSQPLAEVEVVCIGATKRVAANAFVAFEFRLRTTADALPVRAGQRLTWSVVFPLKVGLDLPPESFLHLPHKCNFIPFLFLERRMIQIKRADVILDESGGGRLTLTDKSSVVAGAPYSEWTMFQSWSVKNAIERIRSHTAGPLDLDTELQEEIVLQDYEIGAPDAADTPGQLVYPITMGQLKFSAMVSADGEGAALRQNIDELRKLKKGRPCLYGLMHYERCRLALQLLTAFRPQPDYLTISKENIKKSALLKAISFT